MRTLLLAPLLLLYHPADVTGIGAEILLDGSVRLSWTLPYDASVTGVTIFRERLDGDDNIYRYELQGLQTSYTDGTGSATRSYRYWIHTRDAQGDLSDGVWVEVIGEGDYYDDDDDDEYWEFWCWARSAAARGGLSSWLAAAFGLLLLLAARR